jgi:Flp pilus assembly protein TadD
MCRKLALAATALCLLGAPALAAKAPAPAPAAPQPAIQPIGGPAQAQPPVAPPRKPTAQEVAEIERLEPLARAAFWAHQVDSDPRDAVAGVKLARALRDLGRYDDAEAAADRVLVIDPANAEALMESARDYIAEGQGFFAIDPAQHASMLAPKDWRPVSLLAIALEQAKRDDEALTAHQRAVELAPDNPAALSNLAMYYAAHGQTRDAEALLRRAAAMPGASAQVRQNLALILGLQGRIDEAEHLARRDLPPGVVDNNLAYLRAAQTTPTPRNWDSLRGAP